MPTYAVCVTKPKLLITNAFPVVSIIDVETANNKIYKTMHPDNLPRMNALLEFTLTQLIVKYDVVCSLANFERQSNFWRVYQPVACSIFSIQ